MACPSQDITETELSILRILWKDGPQTTRAITEVLYPAGTASHFATVQSLLGRLEEKGFVLRKRGPRPQLFEARIAKEEVIGRRLRSLIDGLCEGSLSPLLSHLVKAKKLTAAEHRELRKMLEDLEARDKGARRRE